MDQPTVEQPTVELDPLLSDNGDGDGDHALSVFEAIQAEVDERAADEHLDLPIPGWFGRLIGRYTVMPRDVVMPFISRVNAGQDPVAQEADNIDFLIRSLDSLWVVDDDGERSQMMVDGAPVGFDHNLADLIGAPEAASARDVVRFLFRDNVIACASHSARVMTWVQDTSQAVEGAVSEGK